MLWTPKARLRRSKSALGMPQGCQKRLESVPGRAKDDQKRGWRAPGQHLEPICLGERRQNAFGSIFEGFRGEIPVFFWIACASIFDRFGDRFLIAFRSLFRSVSSSRVKNPIGAEP